MTKESGQAWYDLLACMQGPVYWVVDPDGPSGVRYELEPTRNNLLKAFNCLLGTESKRWSQLGKALSAGNRGCRIVFHTEKPIR